VEEINPHYLKVETLLTLQLNLGNRCNQQCRHCHVQAGPYGKNVMPPDVMLRIIDFLGSHRDLTVDMTGGCPELNPDFKFFIAEVIKLVQRVMIRTNLTVFLEPGLDWIPKWYRDHKVIIIASLPCYTSGNVDRQRGEGVFDKSIQVLKMLNGLGYGEVKDLELNLVYNPGANFLPSRQAQLEADYKKELNEKYGVKFNNLYTITNAPIGRFKQYLKANGQLEQYQQLLVENFNPDTAANIMCRNLVSIDYKGVVYNCDFNQALGLPVINGAGEAVTIEQLEEMLTNDLKIITDEHCFCCTAGAGSSCTGSLIK
jgi:radical SAM/Cys-rich protein